MPELVLDQAAAEKLRSTMEEAAKGIEKTRADMNTVQSSVADALKRIEKIETGQSETKNVGQVIEQTKKELASLATRVEGIASEHTVLLETSRKATSALSTMRTTDGPFASESYRPVGPTKALFNCRQQAIEIGYFLMACSPNAHKRQAGTKWLNERSKDLRFLPTIPKDLTAELSMTGKALVEQVMKGNLDYAAQDLSTIATPGSLLTFPQFVDTIIRNVEEHGVFRRNATIFPMGSDTVHIPRRKAGLGIYWINEANAPSETDPQFDMLKMEAKKYAALHQYSSELGEDVSAAIALASFFMLEWSLAIAAEEDRIGFNGTGTGGNSPGFAGFVGVLGAERQAYAAEESEDLDKVLKYDAATGLDRTDEATLRGLRSVIGLCHTWATPGAKWYGHRTVISDFQAIETTGAGPVNNPNIKAGDSLLSYPVERVEQMPASPGTASTGVAAFGDLRRGWMLGDKRKMDMQTSRDFAFNTDQITVRLTGREAVMPYSPTAMVVYVTAA